MEYFIALPLDVKAGNPAPYNDVCLESAPRADAGRQHENRQSEHMNLIPSWLRRGAPSLAHLEIIVYTRKGCHLCDDAWQLLERDRQRWQYQLRKLDVDEDETLRAQYDQCVPVVTVNGKVRFRGRVAPALWQRLLEGELHHAH